jgi:CubicO group peptidase (beta-lactamase class C family)
MCFRLALCLTGLALSLSLHAPAPEAVAADLERAEARTEGLAPESLARIQGMLEDSVRRREIAGGSALVARRGKIVYLASVGMQDAEAGRPLTERTLFRIASMTKPITSTAVLMLVDEGKLALTDPVAKYLPEFERMRVLVPGGPAQAPRAGEGGYTLVPADRAITVHDLLTHTSGLTYRFLDRPYVGRLYAEAGVSDGVAEMPETVAENVRRLARLPLGNQPGSAWEYGLSTDVLGRLVEVVSGLSLDEFFRRRVFEPLAMVDTSFIVPEDRRDRLSALYAPGEDRTIRRVGDAPVRVGALVYTANYPIRDGSRYFSGGAGLSATIGDYARFLQMLLNRGELGGTRLLRPATVDLMTRNQVGDFRVNLPNGNNRGFGYGVGVAIDRAPGPGAGPSPGTYSWGGIFNTSFFVDPQEQLFGILMTQIYPSDHLKLRAEFARLVYEALGGPPARTP